jgi:cyanophycin synthetase
LLLDGPGAVLDVRIEESVRGEAVAAWERAARRFLDAVGWPDEQIRTRSFPGGVSLAFSAPLDCLYAATDLNERAWATALAELRGEKPPDFRAGVASVLDDAASQRNPPVVRLGQEAQSRGLTFLVGEDLVSVGTGTGALLWPLSEPPQPPEVDWTSAHEVPIALVTGSNGKTTVVRLLGAMLEDAGKTPGLTSTDGVTIGRELLEQGDFAGPSGARMVLRHQQVEAAVLETARGGILRRGLPVDRADVAVITNIADDHLGEFGIETLPDLADTKMVVAKVLGSQGTLVLNADDPLLVERSVKAVARLVWFSLRPDSGIVVRHVETGGTAVVLENETVVIRQGDSRTTVAPVAEIPITYSGVARHNIANVLAATAAAVGLGLDPSAIGTAVRRFGTGMDDNPGRANLLEVGGIRILLDFAHNPHGMAALVNLARTLPATHRLMLIGQAGDRSDEAIRALARASWELGLDYVIVKDMEEYLRGRAPGEVPGIMADEFMRLGLPETQLSRAEDEVSGVRTALEWARPGDLLVLAVHEDRRSVLALLDQLSAYGWRAGEALPR